MPLFFWTSAVQSNKLILAKHVLWNTFYHALAGLVEILFSMWCPCFCKTTKNKTKKKIHWSTLMSLFLQIIKPSKPVWEDSGAVFFFPKTTLAFRLKATNCEERCYPDVLSVWLMVFDWKHHWSWLCCSPVRCAYSYNLLSYGKQEVLVSCPKPSCFVSFQSVVVQLSSNDLRENKSLWEGFLWSSAYFREESRPSSGVTWSSAYVLGHFCLLHSLNTADLSVWLSEFNTHR